jgi:hypothetical protein
MSNCPYKPIKVTRVEDRKGKEAGRSLVGSLLLTTVFVGMYLLGWKIRKLKKQIKELANDSTGTDNTNRKSIRCSA